MSNLVANLAHVRRRLAEAAERTGRDPEAITLVTVTKGRPAEEIIAAWQLGIRDFGENRVEEAAAKIPAVEATLKSLGGLDRLADRPRWHMIGHVQSRKADEVVEQFSRVHSVDTVRLADRLSRAAVKAGKTVPIFLELNLSGEASKFGFGLSTWPGDRVAWATFVSQVEEIASLPGLRVEGLMTMAPIGGPEMARPVFRKLAQVRLALLAALPLVGWDHLSMGMTDDFEAAVEEGATMVRIGRALFEA